MKNKTINVPYKEEIGTDEFFFSSNEKLNTCLNDLCNKVPNKIIDILKSPISIPKSIISLSCRDDDFIRTQLFKDSEDWYRSRMIYIQLGFYIHLLMAVKYSDNIGGLANLIAIITILITQLKSANPSKRIKDILTFQ